MYKQMSSNENGKDNDTSSQNSFNIENNSSSNYLLRSNSANTNNTSNAKKHSSSPIDKKEKSKSITQTSIGSYEKRNSIVSATEDVVSLNLNSDPEYIDITNDNKKRHPFSIENLNLTSLSHKNEQSSYLRDDTLSRSNIIKNFCYDICIPLDKKGGSKNVEDFYEIDYEKFQQFCDNPKSVKPKPSINDSEDKYSSLHRQKSSYSQKMSFSNGYPLDNEKIKV